MDFSHSNFKFVADRMSVIILFGLTCLLTEATKVAVYTGMD